jgi:magnesium transporter
MTDTRQAPGDDHRMVRDALEHASVGAARLADAIARPVSLVRVGRKRRRRPASPPPAANGRVVACAVYHDGERVPEEFSYLDALRTAGADPDGFAWLGLYQPSLDLLTAVGRECGLDTFQVEDAISAGQRPRLTADPGVLSVVLKTARYVEHGELTDDSEVIDTGEIVVFVGDRFVVTVRHGAHGELTELRNRLEKDPTVLRQGPTAVLHAICDRVVDDYLAVTERITEDIDKIEAEVFNRTASPSTTKVYQLKREILQLKHAATPLAGPLRTLADGAVPLVHARTRRYFRDVAGHLEAVTGQIAHFDELLSSILQANLTRVTVAQNEDMRRISAWVAIAAVPTAIAGIYGMNFEHMPELKQVWGYPAVLALMAIACVTLYRAFKRNGWL